MLKRITGMISVLTAGVCAVMPFAQPVSVSAAEIYLSGEGTESVLEVNTVLRENVQYAIVPCCAGSSAVDLNGTAVGLSQVNRGAGQRWTLHKSGEFWYISCGDANKTLRDSGGKGASGALLTVGSYDGRDAFLWRLEDMHDGTFVIHSGINDKVVLDIYGSKSENGTQISLSGYHGKSNQRFRFIDLSTVVPMNEWGASRTDCTGTDWDFWDGAADTSWYSASQNVFAISSAAQLAGLAQLVKSDTADFAGKTVSLTRDLDLCRIEWQPIGTSDRPFRGSFTGNGHAVVGLSVTGTGDEVGFFGHFAGGSIGGFAIRGSVSGDWNTGGVCGKLESGHISDVYSEVTITRATNDNCGGICGRVGYAGYVERCTQNARVTSTSSEPDRGGIGGYCPGTIRWCVNMQTVDSRWDYVGGIAGHLVGGRIEYCANYGDVVGGNDTESAGGIFGKGEQNAFVYACYNSGDIWSSGDDYIGGIGGRIVDDTPKVFRCVNLGDVQGRNYVGGVLGEGNCTACLNTGYVQGKSKVGSVTGNTKYRLDWCRGLSWTAADLNGKGGSYKNGGEWISASDILNGKACCDLNSKITVSGYADDGSLLGTTFYQNLGSDPTPVFSGGTVVKSGSSYVNQNDLFRVQYDKQAGTVREDAASDAVTLTAAAKNGYRFDHYELITAKTEKREMHNGQHDAVTAKTETVSDAIYTLEREAASMCTVKAYFVYDDGVPDDLRQSVDVTLETVTGCGSWKSETVPVYLTDSAGKSHIWELRRTEIDGQGETVSHTFDLGSAFPTAVCVYPNTSSGALVMKASIRINGADAVTSEPVKIQSGWNAEALSGSRYIFIPLQDIGKAFVMMPGADGEMEIRSTYGSCSEAWEAAQQLGDEAVIQLESPWLTKDELVLNSGKVTLDLNGYPVIRSLRGNVKSGSVFRVNGGELCITDSTPDRESGSAFTGGSIQGGRSKDSAGLIQVNAGGTLTMNGGTLYNGGTSDHGGGAVQNMNGTVTLDHVTVSDCFARGASGYDNFGGAIYTDNGTLAVRNSTVKSCRGYDHAGALMVKGGTAILENTEITGCRSEDDEGGAIYIDKGELHLKDCAIQYCTAHDDGGAIFQKKGTVLCENVLFEGNSTTNSGGAVYIDTDDPTWFVGCEFHGNTAGDHGGAIWLDENNLYLENCTVTGNTSSGKAGGIYLTDDGSIDLCGKTVIRDNDGTDTKDNLVLEKGAYIYDQGLCSGSVIHVRLNSGTGTLTQKNHQISEYHMQYFKSDSGELYMKDQVQVDTRLQASVFTEGSFARIAAAVIVTAIGLITLIMLRKKRKGEAK